jgi:hypothetical protein
MKKGALILLLLLIAGVEVVSCKSKPPTPMPPQHFSGVAKYGFIECPPSSYGSSGYYKVGSSYEIELVDGRITIGLGESEIAELTWERADGPQPHKIWPGEVFVLALGEDEATKVGILNCSTALYVKSAARWDDIIPGASLTPDSPWSFFPPTPMPTRFAVPTIPELPTIPSGLLTPRPTLYIPPTIPSRLLTPRPTIPSRLRTPRPTFRIPTPIPTISIPTLPSLP